MSANNPQPRDLIRGARLRAFRKQRCGLSLERAAGLVGWHGSKLSRTENGLRGVTNEEIAMLVTAWGLPVKERDQVLKELSTGASDGWWDRPIAGVPGDIGTLASYESEANEMVTVATSVVPGLLQTRETAMEVLAADGMAKADIERHWIARRRRQQGLIKFDYTVYLAESALLTPWGGRSAHRAQLAHLLRSDEIGLSRIRIIPRWQQKVILLHTWHWMRFPLSPPVVHVELVAGSAYIHDTERFANFLGRLDCVAITREGSRKLIKKLMDAD